MGEDIKKEEEKVSLNANAVYRKIQCKKQLMQKEDKSCEVWDVQQLQSILKCHIDFFPTLLSSRLQKNNLIHNLSTHDLSVDRENRDFFPCKKNSTLEIFIPYFP